MLMTVLFSVLSEAVGAVIIACLLGGTEKAQVYALTFAFMWVALNLTDSRCRVPLITMTARVASNDVGHLLPRRLQ